MGIVAAALRWLLASRAAQWASVAGASALAILAALSSAKRRGARDARNQIEDDTDDHIIQRHQTREAVDEAVRRDPADAVRDRLRRDGLGPRPRD